MRRRIVSVTLIALGLVAGSTQLARADSANNIFRFGAGWVVPNGKSTVDSGGQDLTLNADNAWAYFVGYERRVIPWLGIDFQVLYAKPDFTATPVAGGPTTTQAEPTLTGNFGVNFHVFARSRFDLYLGAFAGYTVFDETFDNAFGYGGLLGLDIGLTKSGLVLTGSVRYSQTDADLKQISGASLPYDPLVYELGLGWRF